MLQIFSTREIASGIYLTLIFLWLVSKKDGARAVTTLIKTACKAIIVVPIVCLLGYAAVLVYGLQLLPFWEWGMLKDVILWVLFVAVPICFKAGTKSTKDYSFKRMILDNFLWSAILEFFVGEFTFSLAAEIVILPVFTLIAIFKDYDKNKSKYKQYQKEFDGVTTAAGLLLLCFTTKEAITTITKDGAISLLVSFAIPLIFSVMFLPIVYGVAVIARYHDLFVRLYIRNHMSKEGLAYKKKRVFFVCGVSYNKLQKFERAYYRYISTICAANDDESLFDFISEFNEWE